MNSLEQRDAVLSALMVRDDLGLRTPACRYAEVSWRNSLGQHSQGSRAITEAIVWSQKGGTEKPLGNFAVLRKALNVGEPTVLILDGPFAGFLAITRACSGQGRWVFHAEMCSGLQVVIARPLRVRPDSDKDPLRSLNGEHSFTQTGLVEAIIDPLKRLSLPLNDKAFRENCALYSQKLGILS